MQGKGWPPLVSQAKLNLLINSLDILVCIQNPNLTYIINKFLLILTAQDVSYQVTTLKELLVQHMHFSD